MDVTRATPPTLALEPLVLLVHTLGRERGAALLEGLAPGPAAAARVLLASVQALGSAQRQARLVRAFGIPPDAPERLRALVHEAPPPLAREVLARLPPFLRSLFPARETTPVRAPSTPALARLAARLVQEGTR